MAKEEVVAGVQPSIEMAVTLQLRYVIAGLVIGPVFGVPWAALLYGVAWLLSWDAALIQCYAVGWLFSTLTFCVDHSLRFVPDEIEIPRRPTLH